MRNPNTGAITFPEPLNRKLTPPGQGRDYGAELTEKKREFDLSHPQSGANEDQPNVTSVNGIQFYKRGKDWTQVTGQGASKVDPELNELLNEKKAAWSAYINPKEGADKGELARAYNTSTAEVKKHLNEKRSPCSGSTDAKHSAACFTAGNARASRASSPCQSPIRDARIPSNPGAHAVHGRIR